VAELAQEIDIVLAETIAASWGLLLSSRKAHLMMDNQAVAFAFAKGHCKVEVINRMLRRIFAKPVRGSITWVPSGDQVADGPTRDFLPSPVPDLRDTWKKIHSFLFSD